jgi:hypothetical protein
MGRAANDTVDREGRKARFAQYVADGCRPFEAGGRMGLTKGQAARVWANIKADLGAQAV